MRKINKRIERNLVIQRHPLDDRPFGQLIRNNDNHSDDHPYDESCVACIGTLELSQIIVLLARVCGKN